jgi:hypothetical protein
MNFYFRATNVGLFRRLSGLKRLVSQFPSRLVSSRKLPELSKYVRDSSITKVDVDSAMRLIRKLVPRKSEASPRRNAIIIPANITKILTASLEDSLDRLPPEDLRAVAAVGGSDEYLLYKVARSIEKRVFEFTPTQLTDILTVFSERDACDESLIQSSLAHILSPGQSLPYSLLISLNYSLAKLNIRHMDLIDRICVEAGTARNLPCKEICRALVSFARLGLIDRPETTNSLWNSLTLKSLEYLNQEELHELMLAALILPHTVPAITLMPSMVSRTNKLRKHQNRLRILQECVRYGLVPYVVESGPKRGSWTPGGSLSSGLHMEVCNTLDDVLGRKYQTETAVGEFNVDILID